jgi:hypothetical protein
LAAGHLVNLDYPPLGRIALAIQAEDLGQVIRQRRRRGAGAIPALLCGQIRLA